MKKANRVVVFSIKQEKARQAFGAAIFEIAENCTETITDKAIYFESDKNLEELLPLLMATGIDGNTDSFHIFTVLDKGKGFGSGDIA